MTKRSLRYATPTSFRRVGRDDFYSLVKAYVWRNMHGPSSSSVQIFYRPRSRSDIMALLRERLPALAAVLPLQRVVLFGSTAQERHTVASDIDLLAVYRGEPRPDAYMLVRKCSTSGASNRTAMRRPRSRPWRTFWGA